jgi:hypothetical protein
VKVDAAEGANGDSNGEGSPKASNYDAVLGQDLVFDPKGDLHYRNCSDAGIFGPAVASSFHVTREELTEGILS